MLNNLGRRIERLLYFGFVLLLICALEVYFTAAATFFKPNEESTLDSAIEVIEKNRIELQKIFDDSRKVHRPSTDREIKIAELRLSLGLPSQKGNQQNSGPSYKARINELLVSLPGFWTFQNELWGSIDSDQNPEQIVKILKELKNSRTRDRGTVLGIETPRLLTLQYGAADFRVSSQFLAGGLLVALYPLSLVWLGSFYITRQRELLGIRVTKDIKQVFPHILNILAVDFSNLLRRLGKEVKMKDTRTNVKIAQIASTTLRGLFLVIAVSPLLLAVGYCTLQLLLVFDLAAYQIAIAWISYSVLFVLAAALVAQEIIVLRGKIFYE